MFQFWVNGSISRYISLDQRNIWKKYVNKWIADVWLRHNWINTQIIKYEIYLR